MGWWWVDGEFCTHKLITSEPYYLEGSGRWASFAPTSHFPCSRLSFCQKDCICQLLPVTNCLLLKAIAEMKATEEKWQNHSLWMLWFFCWHQLCGGQNWPSQMLLPQSSCTGVGGQFFPSLHDMISPRQPFKFPYRRELTPLNCLLATYRQGGCRSSLCSLREKEDLKNQSPSTMQQRLLYRS